MRDRIKAAFDSVRAEDELKRSAADFVARRTRGYAGRSRRLRPGLAAAFACLCLALMGGYWLYFTPTARISIDINPSIELSVNRFDRVIAVKGYNADGEALARALSIAHTGYTDAVRQVLASETVSALLDGDGVMTIAVVGPEGAQRNRILSAMEACTAGRQNAYCYAFRAEEAAQAHELGLSYGKYRAYLEIQALDPGITPETIRDMSMRDIWRLMEELSAGEEEEEQGSGGARRGPGNGWGGKWRNPTQDENE